MRILSVNLVAPGFSPKVLGAVGLGKGWLVHVRQCRRETRRQTDVGVSTANAEDVGSQRAQEPKGPSCLENRAACT